MSASMPIRLCHDLANAGSAEISLTFESLGQVGRGQVLNLYDLVSIAILGVRGAQSGRLGRSNGSVPVMSRGATSRRYGLTL